MLETLLDRLRKGELEVRSEMVDAFLKAGDVIKDQLAGHRGDGQSDSVMAAAVYEELKQFSDENNQSVATDQVSHATKPQAKLVGTVVAEEFKPLDINISDDTGASIDTGLQVTYRIEFSRSSLNPDAMENLLANLRSQGTLIDTTSSSDIDQCKLKLTTVDSEEDVWETLAFIVDPDHLVIEKEISTASVDTGASAAPKDLNSKDSAAVEPVKKSETESGANKDNADKSKATPVASSKSAAAANENTSIRVSIDKVDQMINLVGELVITQSMLAQTASQFDPVVFEKMNSGMNQLERNTRDLQESVMSIRMMPISFVFSRYPRLVRDLASKLDKRVELKTVGESTELDKGLIEKISDPLTHLVRNSLDHGIEMPAERIAASKPLQGTITLRAFHQGGSIVIEVGDDGGGLNREKILAKAKERGLNVHDGMFDQEVWMLIFEAGFSTAEKVTDVSGRGVGMDVVRRNILSMGGRIEIDSVYGIGTRISIRLPLTLAILDGLSVTVDDQMFIVPLTYILESLQPLEKDIKTISGRGRVVQVRGEYLPVIALHEFFNLQPKIKKVHEGILVILEADGRKAAMFVDDLVGQHQVVIKSLETNYRRIQGVSGATIMGDGKVALILDTAALVMASQ